MYLFSKINLTKANLISFLLALFPLSFIAGNMIININILLLIIFSVIFLFFKKSLFEVEYFLLDKIIFLFFFLILFTELQWYRAFYKKKRVFRLERWLWDIVHRCFFKYLFLYSLKILIEKNVIDLKLFFITCSISSLFVSLDIFYQYKFGHDIFGFKTVGSGRKLGGPFGDELIAGGFIQRFSLFSFFVLPLFFSSKSKKISKYLIPILFIVFFTGIILSGNRMPLLLFVFSIFLILLFNNR